MPEASTTTEIHNSSLNKLMESDGSVNEEPF